MNKYVIPDEIIENVSSFVKNMFLKWRSFMYENVIFNMPDSEIHAQGHCERVLLFAVMLGEKIFGDSVSLVEPLAHAAIFHDSRRQDDYLDTGHGARAAVYYTDFCKKHPDIITFHESTVYLMRYHDLNDKLGIESIEIYFKTDSDIVLKQYAIFKDSDALDRFRLGSLGLDPRYLRTPEAKDMISFAEKVVKATVPADLLAAIDAKVKATLQQTNKNNN